MGVVFGVYTPNGFGIRGVHQKTTNYTTTAWGVHPSCVRGRPDMKIHGSDKNNNAEMVCWIISGLNAEYLI